MKIQAKRSILLALSLLLLLGGCGYKDLDKRFFVVGIGVDKVENKENVYKITLKLAVPSADIIKGSSEFEIITEEAETIAEAVRILKSKVDKELDFGHAKIIILGESVTDEDITSLLYWFVRRRDIQKIAWMAVGDPSAEEVLKGKTKSERIPSNSLFLSFGRSGTESAYIISKYLFQFRRELFNTGRNAVLPVIQAPKDDLFEINQAIVFNDDRKQEMKLNSAETRLLNVLNNTIDKIDVKVNKEDQYFIIATESISVHYKIVEGHEKSPELRVDLKLTGILEEAKQRLFENKMEYYGKIASIDIKNEIEKLLVKFQEANVDPLGFGLLYQATHFQNDTEMKEWQELYPSLKIDVHVDTELEGVGLVK
ncbi:Ger(x)C family spore germination protein [Caldibacillus lycopersici]|uniref:Ger(X)C family spore germination protein n=1 Tax=Perspicuibacillus lycopersici TaxID=1325689 RepID=A0AAE3IRY4_9BACI|nr:Ger(x)C family spore germination protein [Perspicuibacillus lycopersici]MCU9613523.1 Ger(x)C family spore germination protein [Perspicuibacillus lycopersici]